MASEDSIDHLHFRPQGTVIEMMKEHANCNYFI